MNDGFRSDGGKTGKAVVRCAIYTRKSTDEGLDRDFNSLQAQREAAEAYIKSQRHLGWTLVRQHYDDGGFSGATMERPALRKLIEDVEAGRVDCVVVYKVDRLSRSLLDFARLVDLFDHRSVSFVSITQQFNTTTSLGRLTLNILLSFAQFEREIISERTRDKMAAARRKGKWVGGVPMLGYDIEAGGGRLVINPKEAEQVRTMFELYRTTQSLSAVLQEIERRNWRTKSWVSGSGRKYLGRAFTKFSLRRVLTNAVYAGKVEYRGATYVGEHEAIIEPDLWDEINARLRSSRRQGSSTRYTPQNAMLSGLLKCATCNMPMVATYTSKKGRRFRYYVCRTARKKGWQACPTKSVPASVIEDSVIAKLREILGQESTCRRLRTPNPDWKKLSESDPLDFVRSVVETVNYEGTSGSVTVTIREKGHAA